MESCWGVVARWYCTLLCSVGTGPADTRWFIPCKSAQNVADASVFLYAAHSSRMLPIQKCWDCLSPLVQIGCFGGADLLQCLREEQQLVKAKHKLHWNSCSVLQKLHAGSWKFQSTHHFVYAIRQAQVTRSCGKLLLHLVLLLFPGVCQQQSGENAYNLWSYFKTLE